ncbi:hypothetical protein PS1_021399 [Malus domestica]
MDTTSETFPAPKTPKPLGSVVCAYGHIYHIADPLSGTPECNSKIPNLSFARYKPGHTGFVGRAVVVDQTIYGLLLTCDKVLAFSFGISYGEEGCNIAWQLVHLGDKDFCLAQTRDDEYSFVHQDICITTFQIVAGEGGCPMIKTVHSTVYTVDTNELGPFGIYCSFTA